MGLEHRTVRDSEDELLAILDRDGGVIIEGILNDEDLEQVRSDLSPYVDASATGQNLFWGLRGDCGNHTGTIDTQCRKSS